MTETPIFRQRCVIELKTCSREIRHALGRYCQNLNYIENEALLIKYSRLSCSIVSWDSWERSIVCTRHNSCS